MDLKMFYQKIAGVAASITEDPVVVISSETSDGGKAGARAEVSRRQAAQLIVEGRARLAPAEEAQEYRQQVKQRAEQAQAEAEAAKRTQVVVVSEQELKALRPPGKKA